MSFHLKQSLNQRIKSLSLVLNVLNLFVTKPDFLEQYFELTIRFGQMIIYEVESLIENWSLIFICKFQDYHLVKI